MASVWIVSSGEYSDYTIRGVFSTLEAANAFHARIKAWKEFSEVNDVEEVSLDRPIDPEDKKERKHAFKSKIRIDDGKLTETEVSWVKEEFAPCGPLTVARGHIYSISLESQEHANKLAIEARQKFLREQAQAQRLPSP